MIDIIFDLAGEKIMVRINGKDIKFGKYENFGLRLAPIEGLKLNYVGVCKEFPDLKIRDDWKEEAQERFRDKINKMKTEEEITQYIINDLQKFGYIAQYKQKIGHRPIKIN